MTSAHIRGGVALALGVAALISINPCGARAQDASRVTVALVRQLPDSTASATIIRTLTGTTLLLREDADAATLATAMTSIYRARERVFDSPEEKLVINLHGQRRLAALASNERRLGDYYLARLHAAKIEVLDQVGPARLTSITLEPRGRR